MQTFRPSQAGPSRLIWALFLGLVFAKAAAYWVGSAIYRPDDPLSTIVIYRGKDIESLPIVRSLAHLSVGEPSLYENHNQGVLPERLVPWIVHAFLFRLLGASGFVAADLVMTPARFVLLAWLLRSSGVSRTVAAAVSAVLTCSAIDDFGEMFPRLAGIPIRFWGLRLPRPYVSELVLLLAMLGSLAALNAWRERERGPTWAWMLAGGALAVLAQCDLYSAAGLGLAFLSIWAMEVWRTRHSNLHGLMRGTTVALGTALLCGVPAILQSYFTNPQGMIRLGLFPISRLHPPVIDTAKWYAATAGLAVVAWVLGRQSSHSMDPHSDAQSSSRVLFVATCIGALAAMPVTSIVLGKGIELYHYRDAFTRYFSLALVVVTLHAGGTIWRIAGRTQRRPERAAAPWAIVLPAALVCVFFTWRFATANPQRADHMRSEFKEWSAFGDYRQPFVELVRELSRTDYHDHLVLGTFDHQVWSWWMTFRGGYSYLADACTTNATDAELERRTAQLARLVGMSRSDFETFARRRYVMIFWMSCSKYQGTQAYSFAPLDDYSEEDRRTIAGAPDYLNFTVALPLSQQARLGNLFDVTRTRDMGRLDLVVLTKDESMKGLAPPASDFELTFENAVFRLWKRR